MIESAEDGSYLVELADGVLRLSFNRPQFGNAIPKTAVPGLTDLFRVAQATPQIRCILVRGEGNIFSAGGDVASFSESIKQDVAARQADFARRLPLARGLIEAIAAFDRPIVASVRGAVGSLMEELIEQHMREHVARPGLTDQQREAAAEEMLALIRRYGK